MKQEETQETINYYFVLYITAYIKAAAALCVVCLLTDIAATILTGLGLRTQDHRDKHKYYRFAVFCMAIACEYCMSLFVFFRFLLFSLFPFLYNYISHCVLVVSLLIALIIYPICFAAELNFGKVLIINFIL